MKNFPLTTCPQFYLKAFTPLPCAERENGKLKSQVLAPVDLSNVLHYPVQDRHKVFLADHSRHLGGVCVDGVISVSQSRGVTILEVHVDDHLRVPAQKRGEQRRRDTLQAEKYNEESSSLDRQK